MKFIRAIVGGIALIWLVGVFMFGAGATYLTRNPEAAVAVAVGAASVDPDGSFLEQPGNFAAGAKSGGAMIREVRQAEQWRDADDRERRRPGREPKAGGWGDDTLGDDWGD